MLRGVGVFDLELKAGNIGLIWIAFALSKHANSSVPFKGWLVSKVEEAWL